MASINLLAVKPVFKSPMFVSGVVRDQNGSLIDLKLSDSISMAIEFHEGLRNDLHEMRENHMNRGEIGRYSFIVISALKYYKHGNNIYITPAEEIF